MATQIWCKYSLIYQNGQVLVLTVITLVLTFITLNLFSEHLGTHCTLELWGKAIHNVNQDFNGGQWKRNNSMWKLHLSLLSKLPLFDKTSLSRAWTNVRTLESSRTMIEIRTRIFALPKLGRFANFVFISNNSTLNKITHKNNSNLPK